MDSRRRRRKKSFSARKTSPEWNDYYTACRELNEKFKEDLFLRSCAIKVFIEVKELARDPMNTVPITKLTKILQTTKEVLKGPALDDHRGEIYREDILKLQKYSRELCSFPATKLLVGTIACLLGTVIVVASGILGAISFGLATPVTILGIVFGASMILGGVAVATGLIGSSFLMFSAPLLSSALRDNPLRKEMNELGSTAKRAYGIGTTWIY